MNMTNRYLQIIMTMGLLLLFAACNETEEKPSTENDVAQVDTNTSGQVDNNSSDTIKLQGLRIETTYDNPEEILIKKFSTGKTIRSKATFRVIAMHEDGHEEEFMDRARTTRKTSKIIRAAGTYILFIEKESEGNLIAKYEDLIIEYPIKATYAKYIYVDVEHKATPEYQRGVTLSFTLLDQPDSDVTTTVHLNPSEGLSFLDGSHSKTITFDNTQWNDRDYNINLDVKYTDLQNANNATLTIDPLISEDTALNGKVIDNVTLYKKLTPQLIAPYAQQLRGAVRGSSIRFQVASREEGLRYKLVNPPEGMKILGEGESYSTYKQYKESFEWKVPLDMEEGPHLITVQAEDSRGNVGEISFNITVPKTTLIQTEVVNNELIVTDTTSRLYGMKMKGHNGEDISNMELRSVGYRDLWKKRLELDEGDVPEYVPFVIYNMPEKLDIKFPEFMENKTKVRNVKAKYFVQKDVNYPWEGRFKLYDYEGSLGVSVESNMQMIVITKSQKL